MYKEFKTLMDEYQNTKDTLRGKERAEYLATNYEPINRTLTIKDATTERILDRFVVDGIFNQSWASDEAGQFFGGHSLKADTHANAISSFTNLWSVGEASRMRSTRIKGATHKTNAYDCRMTLDLAGQAVILENAINDPLLRGQGFLARFLMSAEPSLIGHRDWQTDRDPYQDPMMMGFWQKCWALLERGCKYHPNGTPKRLNMPFGKGAKQVLKDYQQRIEYEQQQGARLANMTAFASRMAENASRIATLLAFYDGCEQLEANYLHKAFLLTDYSMNEWLSYGEQASDEPSDIEKLLAWLVKKCKAQMVDSLPYAFAQSNIGVRALRKKEPFALAVQVLYETNHVKLIEDNGKRTITINPCLLS